MDSLNDLLFDDSFKFIGKKIVKKYLNSLFSIIQVTNEVTENLAFHKFIKNTISVYFNDIHDEMNVIFTYFWKYVQTEIQNKVLNNENKVLRTKQFRLSESLHILKKIAKGCSQYLSVSTINIKIIRKIYFIRNY